MLCTSCSTKCKEDARFCPNCGSILKQAENQSTISVTDSTSESLYTKSETDLICNSCGKEIESGEKFCQYCGVKTMQQSEDLRLPKPPTSEVSQRQKNYKKSLIIVAMILVISVGVWFFRSLFLETPADTLPSIPAETSQEGNQLVQDRIVYIDDNFSYYITAPDDIVSDADTVKMYVDNEILLTAREDQTTEDIEAFISSQNGEIAGHIGVLQRYQVKLNKKSTLEELEKLGETFTQSGMFERYSINLAMKVDTQYYPTSDREWQNEWDVTPDGGNWGMEAINAPQMWEYRGQMDWVNVGVLDNQFDESHKDLVFSETLNNKVDNSIENPNHGTHVSGIIAAGFDNGVGISGVMPKVRLYGASIIGTHEKQEELEASGVVTVNKYEAALTWLIVVKECEVVNISYGCDPLFSFAASRGNQNANDYLDDFNTELEDALLAYLKMGFDFVLVKSSGNQNASSLEYLKDQYRYTKTNSEVGYVQNSSGKEYGHVDAKYDILSGITNPSLVNRIIVVGAVENIGEGNMRVTELSHGGERVDIVAPGIDIQSTILKNKYGNSSGTSMAAPHVSGVAAAIFGVNSNLTGAQVKEIICQNASATAYGYEQSGSYQDKYHLLNAEAAIMAALGENSGNYVQAYFDILWQYETKIKEYDWCEGSLRGGGNRVGTLVIEDIMFDEKPELIFLAAEDEIYDAATLYVWTFVDGESKPQLVLELKNFDQNVAGGTRNGVCLTYDYELYIYRWLGDINWRETYTHYDFIDGEYVADDVLELKFSEGPIVDGSMTHIRTNTLNGEIISDAECDQHIDELGNWLTAKLISSSWNSDIYFGYEAQVMGFDETIAYLTQ